jgi:hypothetical protein
VGAVDLGISGYDPLRAGLAIRDFSLSMVQIPGNVLDQRLLKAQRSLRDVEVTVRSIFLQGLLLMDPETAATRVPAAASILKRWHEWLATRALRPMQAAIAVAHSFPCDYCAVGVESRDQLMAILDSWDVPPMDAPELASEALAVIDPRRWTNEAKNSRP